MNKEQTNALSFIRTPYISPSRLKLWLKCPLAYKLRYIDGHDMPATPSLFLGRMVHKALEYYYLHLQRGLIPSAEAVAASLKKLWAPSVRETQVMFPSRKEERACLDQALALTSCYLETVPRYEAFPSLVEGKLEASLVNPLTGENHNVALLGVLDLVLETKQGPVLVDFKTAARTPPSVDVLHELQLSCYSFLYRQLHNELEAGIEIRTLVKQKTPKLVVQRFGPRTEAHFRRLFAVVKSYQQALATGNYHISPGLECSFCSFRESFCDQATKDEGTLAEHREAS